MEPLIIPATERTPKIHLETESNLQGKNIFEISGESRPEDALTFYAPVIDWLEEFKQHLIALETEGKDKKIKIIRLKFKMDYYNSVSTECIFHILRKAEEMLNSCKLIDIKAIWIYDEQDEDIYEKGEELKNLTKVPFQLSCIRDGEKFE